MKDIIDVIIVSFERPEETFLTIEALLKGNDNARVILVHDGSIHKPNLDSLDTNRVIQIDKEHSGEAKSMNAGFKLVQSEYVAVMHNDMIIRDVGWIKKAVNFLKTNKEAGLICSLGWQVIYNDLLNSPFHSVSSEKQYITCKNHTILKKAFEEVWSTDNHMNVFKAGIKADERYGCVGVALWLNIKAKGLKCYVMRLDDAVHFPSHTQRSLDDKRAVDRKEQGRIQTKVTILRMKELGITRPTREELN